MTGKVKQKVIVHIEKENYSSVRKKLWISPNFVHFDKTKLLAKVVEAILKQGKVGLDSGDPSILGIPSAHSDLGLDFKR